MALTGFLAPSDTVAVPVICVSADGFAAQLATLTERERSYLATAGFEPQEGRFVLVPSAEGRPAFVLFGFDEAKAGAGGAFAFGKLGKDLPAGDYRLKTALAPLLAEHAAFAWAAGQYVFARYKADSAKPKRLVVPDGVNRERLGAQLEALELCRDLINTPANDLGPEQLEQHIRACGERHGAHVAVIADAALKERNFPLIHAVGAGSLRRPRLIDLTWGDEAHPLVTLVGKGVVFDTGGLDIKPSSNMLLMKKDMGGAATVIALAHMVMAAKLPVRLRVLVPAVENAISGDAFRPSDVFVSRKGLSVEIGNTDAEGRLVLADALALADEEAPELLVDMATLTGAARVALGPDLPPFFCNDDAFAAEVQAASHDINDPVWRMPLWQPYMGGLDSKIADLNNAAPGLPGFAGAITAALFLSRFVEKAKIWAHFDIYGWTPNEKPGRPQGAEMQAARALFTVIEKKFPPRP